MISCVMPTRPIRERWAGQAVKYFLRQTYADRELVIAAATRPAALLVDDRIRFVEVTDSVTLGEKRNLVNAAARGEFIAHWDDDDWYAPDRLARQIAALGPSDVMCGSRSLPFVDVSSGTLSQYTWPDKTPGACCATLLYRKSYWEAGGFPSRQVGSDTLWMTTRKPSVIDVRDVCIATTHSNNTCRRSPSSRQYVKLDQRLEDLIPHDDFAFYRSMQSI